MYEEWILVRIDVVAKRKRGVCGLLIVLIMKVILELGCYFSF